MQAYNTWINSFYYDVTDPKVLDPNADNSGNGLTNFQKFLLNLNPKSYDTLGLGRSDTESLAMGIDPLTGGKLTADQQNIINKYIDLEVAMNRLTLAKLQSSEQGQVAGASTTQNQATTTASSMSYVGTTQYLSGVSMGQQPLNANLDINTSIPGKLTIPSLKLSAPII